MKKITLLLASLIGVIGIGQNLTQETVQPISGQNGVRTSTVTTTPRSLESSNGLMPLEARFYNGTSYHNNPASEEMMPVLAYSTGPYFNVPGNPDISLLENTTLGMGTLGGGMQVSAGNRMAEDIILADDYDITSMDFYGYQTGTPTSPPSINEINVQIWDGDPSLPGSSVVYGDAVTNVLTSVIWSNAYRESETTPGTNRAIHRVTVETPGLSLAAGTYWVDWQMGGTSTSGPWQPPVVILGQSTTGNAMQFTGTWGPFEDTGTLTALGAPVDVYGDCTSCGGGGSEPTLVYGIENQSRQFGVFDITVPQAFTDIGLSPNLPASDFEGAGTIDPSSDGSIAYAIAGTSNTFYSIDVATGTYTSLGTLAPAPGTGTWVGLEFDSNTGILYGLTGNIPTNASLHTIDIGTVTSTLVGTTSAITGGVSLAIDGSGNGYVLDIVADALASIDLATGAGAIIGPIGFGSNFGSGLAYDINSDQIYGSPINTGAGNQVQWYSFDTTTGAGTLIGNMDVPNFSQFGWIGIPGLILNDECSGAIEMACGDSESGDTNNYSDTGGFNASPDAWYSFTGSGATELVTFSLCNPAAAYDSVLTVYDSCGGTQIANNDDSCGLQSELTFLSDGTTTYYVAVEGFGTEAGAFTLTVSCAPVADNDLCADAAPIACGETVAGSTLLATPDTGAPDCGGGNDSPGVWYQIDDTSGLVTDYTVSLCDGGTAYDSKLVIYSGDDCGTLVCVAENDDSCGLQSEVSFQGDGSSTYYILVNGFGSGSSGDFSLNLECAPVPPFNDMIVNSIDVDELGFPYTDPAVPMPAATTEAGGTPAECDNAGVLGVWYNFVPEMGGTANARVISPAGYTSVTFYTAPNEEAVETDLTLVDWFDNQCVPGVETSIPVVAGQAYYVYVANHEGITDIEIDGDFYLGVGDAVVDGFTYFPNPANNELNLDAGTRSIDSATIYNILGQSVVDQAIGATSTRLDVANLSVGTYIMKVVVEGEVGIYKIVKQ